MLMNTGNFLFNHSFFMVSQYYKKYFVTQENYMKLKFQCPQTVLLECSYAYLLVSVAELSNFGKNSMVCKA